MKKLGRVKTLAAASLAALALAAPVALAQTPGTEQGSQKEFRGEGRGRGGSHHGHHRGRMGGAMMFRGLNLSEEQKAQMKQIRESWRERNKPLREQLRAKRQQLRQAGANGAFNEALATQTLTESAGLQAKLMGEHFKLRQEMLAVLTPEQKTQMEQKRAEFKARWAERRAQKQQQEDN